MKLGFSILAALAIDPRYLDEGMVPSIVRRALDLDGADQHYVTEFLRQDGGPSALGIIEGIEEPQRRAMAIYAAELEQALRQLLREMDKEEARRRHPGVVHLEKYPVYSWKVGIGQAAQPILQKLEIIIHFIPIIGQAVGAIEAIFGQELPTGRKLEGWERMIEVIPYAAGLLRSGKSGAIWPSSELPSARAKTHGR